MLMTQQLADSCNYLFNHTVAKDLGVCGPAGVSGTNELEWSIGYLEGSASLLQRIQGIRLQLEGRCRRTNLEGAT